MLKKRRLIIILTIILVLLGVFICMNVILTIQGSRFTPFRGLTGEFSFKEELDSIDLDSSSVKTSGFVNTEEYTIDEYNVFERAKQELEDPDIVISYLKSYDKNDNMWKVRFAKKYEDTDYLYWFETVYMTGKGITVLITFSYYVNT